MFRKGYFVLPMLASWLCLMLPGCHSAKIEERTPAGELVAPFTSDRVLVDGKLDEACYRSGALVESFCIAGRPNEPPPPTKAWLFWQPERLAFAFECADRDLVAAATSPKEHDVDGQDRVELFLWSGDPQDAYYCIEIGARGALHDYAARFYRRFDDEWSLAGLEFAVDRTPTGYCVEGVIARSAMEKMGFPLEPGMRCRLGLFRADFDSGAGKSEPTWIAWIDAQGAKPDFHVAESFGGCALGPEE
ncbi:MAG: carbohydrate-binding family 9-like protein [Pirellulales bacterium]|nr:carbohydrate-binding family 9-like protein [Pirellulales bacterium]